MPRAAAPGVGGETGLEAGVVEERVAVPSLLDRHLRQQETAAGAVLDDQAVTPDLDLVDRRRPRARGVSTEISSPISSSSDVVTLSNRGSESATACARWNTMRRMRQVRL